ncbi:hypothetical protein [Streptomyces sp. NPDC055099]
MAYISRPGISTATHLISGEEIIKLHEKCGGKYTWDDATSASVGAGRFVRSVEELLEQLSGEERQARAFADVAALSETAARRALEEAAVDATQVGGIITFHDTGRTRLPAWRSAASLGSYLIATLGLRSTVAHVPLTAEAGSGGVHALSLAHVLARPDRPFLVVGAEANSSLLTSEEVPLWQKLRMADGGAATLVSATPRGGHTAVRITDDWSYAGKSGLLEPGSQSFSSPAIERDAIADVWAELPLTGASGWSTDITLIHPSGAQIAEAPTTFPGADTHDIGGASILQRLLPLFDQPTAARSGLLLGVSPHHASACRFEIRNQTVH